MEFGKLANVDNVKWDLPKDNSISLDFLTSLKPHETASENAHAAFYIGAPAWGHKEWLGKIYPPKTKAADFLYHYARSFNCIELNTTHYRIPTKDQVEHWTAQVTPEFIVFVWTKIELRKSSALAAVPRGRFR